MRIVDRFRTQQKPCFGFEFFPAKNSKAQENLDRTIDKLAAFAPDFVTVTFGAGGSTRVGSRQLAARLKHEKELEIIAYFAGYGLGPQEISEALTGYSENGVENILVVRGDPPRDPAFRPHADSMVYASDLLDYIRPRYSFCLGAAGYPEGHVQSESPERDADFLKRKVDQGAEYILTNYFYDNRFFFDYVERCRARGVNVPILPGVMPILSLKLAESIAATCGASIPEAVRSKLAAIPEEDKKAAADYGIELAERQCRELLAAGIPGILFYTMNRWESVSEIVNRLRACGML
ncbi:MAG: 5,10-methylenetetrahydrofolate reductase [Chloroflexi bacterium RBG_13_60_9]|nr:MAG: 5,10-methylenetetrahydrofolate reductase [Chloroflexi bacterium RBG_13_60_9]